MLSFYIVQILKASLLRAPYQSSQKKMGWNPLATATRKWALSWSHRLITSKWLRDYPMQTVQMTI
jgi:hypothetical protein